MSLRRPSVTGLVLLLAGWTPSSAGLDEGRGPVPPPAGTPRPAPAQARPARDAKADPPRPAPPPKPAGEDAPTAPPGPEDLVSQAEKAETNGDLEGAIRLLEQALKVEPDHRKALFMLAEVIQQRAANLVRPRNSPLYLQSARAIRRLRETYKTLTPQERQVLATLLYNEACTFAIEDQPEKALDSLAESIDAGFALRDKLATDKELDPIRKSPRFEELMKRVERALAEEKARKLAAGTIPFPFRFALPDLDGKTVTLDDVKGNVTIVTFWGTWCAPCRREVPRYKALLAKYRDRGLKVVGITYERPEVEDVNHKVRAFVEKHEIPYPCPIGDDQTRGLVPNFQGYPTTLFLDHSSTVRVKVAGECSLPEMEAIVELVIRSGEGSK